MENEMRTLHVNVKHVLVFMAQQSHEFQTLIEETNVKISAAIQKRGKGEGKGKTPGSGLE